MIVASSGDFGLLDFYTRLRLIFGGAAAFGLMYFGGV
jgi:hypothetical protein